MIAFNRETLVIVGVIVALASCFYLYKENQKQRAELSLFTSKVSSQISRALVNDDKSAGVVKKPVKIPEVIDEENEEE